MLDVASIIHSVNLACPVDAKRLGMAIISSNFCTARVECQSGVVCSECGNQSVASGVRYLRRACSQRSIQKV